MYSVVIFNHLREQVQSCLIIIIINNLCYCYDSPIVSVLNIIIMKHSMHVHGC